MSHSIMPSSSAEIDRWGNRFLRSMQHMAHTSVWRSGAQGLDFSTDRQLVPWAAVENSCGIQFALFLRLWNCGASLVRTLRFYSFFFNGSTSSEQVILMSGNIQAMFLLMSPPSPCWSRCYNPGHLESPSTSTPLIAYYKVQGPGNVLHFIVPMYPNLESCLSCSH